MKITWPTAIAAVIIIVLAGGVFGLWNIPYITPTPPVAQIPGTTPYQPVAPVVPGTGGAYSGILYLEVVDSVLGTGITTSATTVDVAAASASGTFNFITPAGSDTKAQAANPQAMNTIWAEGTKLIVMPDCTGNPSGGLDYYPAMYYVELSDGATVYELNSKNCFTLSSSNPPTYTINPTAGRALGNRVTKYQASNVFYWNIGKINLYPRQAAADVDIYLSYSTTTLSSVTDASTWVDTAAEITANATLTDDIEDLTFTMIGATNNMGWGKRFFAINQQGYIEEYGATILVTTAMTGIAKPSGWNTITMSTLYAERGFWKDISDMSLAFPAKGNAPKWSVEIPIDATAATASTAYLFKAWINDCQKLSIISEVGTSASVPSAYGFVTSYGLGAVAHAPVLTLSSGAGATMQLMVYLTTAA